jgi:hypothetical protein
MAIRANGSVWSWGRNSEGQLGLGDTTQRNAPTQVTGLAGARQLSLGGFHSMAIGANGTVSIWGDNFYGQLGLGDTTQRNAPTVLTALAGARHVSIGYHFSMAISADGTVWGWGRNDSGQLGLGHTTQRLVPTQATSLTGSRQLSLGYYHAMAIRVDGTTASWGYNFYGQLGLGDEGDAALRSSPTTVTVNCNQEPAAPDALAQYRSDGSTVIASGAWTNESTVVLRFSVSDPDAAQTLTPWVELRTAASFTGTCGTAGAGMYSGTAVSVPTAGTSVLATVTVTGLTQSSTWYWRACSVDQDAAAGPWTAAGGAPPFRVDLTVPTNPSPVNDGTGVDIEWVASTSSLSANWSGATDTPSGIANHDWCFTTNNTNGCATTGRVAVGTNLAASAVTASGLSLTQGTRYYACVRSRDNAGNTAAAYVCSNGQRPDTVLPGVPGAVNDGTGADIDNQGSASVLSANWSAASDTAPGVVADYLYCFSTATGCAGAVVASGATASTSVTASGLSLTVWTTYFSCVRTRDGAGNVSAWACSDGVRVDGTMTLSIAGYETVAVGLIVPDSTVYVEARATVTTDAPGGYTLALHDPDGNGAMYNGSSQLPWNTSGTVTTPAVWSGTGMGISAFGGAQTPARWCTGGQVNCTSQSDPDLRWAQLTGTSQTVSGTNAPINNDVTRIPARITVPTTQPTGTYAGTIALTALAVP